jgi:hypothetical protein
MAFFNPLQFFIFPFVFLIALPLALFAGLTTVLAFFVLFIRLFMVYFDVGLETLRYVFVGHNQNRRIVELPLSSRRPSLQMTPIGSPPSSPESTKSQRTRRRADSIGSSSTSLHSGLGALATISGTGLDRDFEGVGGWRLQDSVDDAEERAWESLNSRLEVPDHHRHHFRSHSGGGGLYMKSDSRIGAAGPERLMRTNSSSPNSSRIRTPTVLNMEPFTSTEPGDSYFPPYASPQLRKVVA